MTDTVFIGNVFALRFQSSDRVVTNLVRGCTFFGNAGLRQNSPLNGGAGGLEAAGCAMMDVFDSTFERNCGWMGNGNGIHDGSGGLAFYNGGANGHVSFVSNCVFRGNFTKNIYSYAGAMQLRHGSTNTVVLLDCAFTGNRWNLSGDARASACICSGAESVSCGPLPAAVLDVYNSWLTAELREARLAILLEGVIDDYRTATGASRHIVGELSDVSVPVACLRLLLNTVWYSLAVEMGMPQSDTLEYRTAWLDAGVFLRGLFIELRTGTSRDLAEAGCAAPTYARPAAASSGGGSASGARTTVNLGLGL